MEAIPVEVRKRIIVLYERGKQTGEIADGLGYCVAAVRRVRQHLRQRGTLVPQTHRRGRKGKFTAERQQRLRELVAQKPDATLEELVGQMDVRVSSSSMHRWLTKLGLVLKKRSLHAAEQQRPDVAERRAAWHAEVKDVDPEKLVFIDEAGARTNITRERGRGLRGERVVAATPHGHWKATTMISGVCLDGACAPMVLDGATDADAFRAYVRQVLVPELRDGDVVVMDNPQPHKAQGVREMIESEGARAVPAAVLAGLQPDREHVVEGEAVAQGRGRPDLRGVMRRHRRGAVSRDARRLRRVLQPLRIRRYVKTENALAVKS